ncbi:chymotrypsin-2-like, partial [Pollicipes pollicipes]|uniref:chymotrypsin-2-like n=1 Tax=Pollicipes pollicipes TaxID=41117 RepID=UPI0018853880
FPSGRVQRAPSFPCRLTARACLEGGENRDVYELPVGRYRFYSPGYPNNYPANIDFTLTVTGEQGQPISISCRKFSLEEHSTCRYDFLSINGDKYCGGSSIATVSAVSLVIRFKSDAWVTSSGFRCVITVPDAASTTTTTTTTTVAPAGGTCCGVASPARVVGGAEATPGQYPWQAGLVSVGATRTFCGGSVINNRYVLTAAHCTAGTTAGQIQVLLGDHQIGVNDGETRYSVSQILDHPSYSSAFSSGFDFSLLRLDREIAFTARVAPVCLPAAGQTYAGATAIATGFGRLGASDPQATTLQEVQLPVWSQDNCRTKWTSLLDNMICAGGYPNGGKSVCMGDSGGPLVTNVDGRFALIGVVSYGQPCAHANVPDVFARVTSVLPWIAQNTADAQTCNPSPAG